MTTEAMYETELLNSTNYRMYRGVYNDFKNRAVSDYKFELAPLEYEEFIDAIEAGYITCIGLREDSFPSAFLVYTADISESIELNIIHCLGDEDESTKCRVLLEKFLELTKDERMSKVVAYPMLGPQVSFTTDIVKYGFKYVGSVVLRFIIGNASSERILENVKLPELQSGYQVVSYTDTYRDGVAKLIFNSFKDNSDALYDTRYHTLDGVKDIVNKIVDNVYGEFLPEMTSILIHDNTPCGIVFANVTGGKIANIPLVAIDRDYRGHGFSEILLNRTMKIFNDNIKLGNRNFSEINVTTDTNNYRALKMYRKVGFKEDYAYPQAYLPIA